MNKEQFENIDDNMNEFFDCKVVDNLDDQKEAPLALMSEDQNEEFKMDKDLGLFEFIQKGDFSTVNGGTGALSAAAAAAGDNQNKQKDQPSTFDFDNFDANANSNDNAGQNAADFFNFDDGVGNQNKQESNNANAAP